MTCRVKILAVLTGAAIGPGLTVLVAWDLYRRYSKVPVRQANNARRNH